MMKNKYLLYLLSLVLITNSCGKDDDDPVINRPPNDFQLLEVPNNSTDISLNPELTWQRALDPDGDDVTYSLLLEEGRVDPGTVIKLDIKATNFTIDVSLETNTVYSWRVIASDENGETTSSEIFSFTTKENQPPENFSLLLVPSNETNVALSPELTWENALDPEGDKVTYKILFDPGMGTPSSIIASNLETTNHVINNTLDYYTAYSWQVIATDVNGNSTNSEIFSFTTRGIQAVMVNADAAYPERDNHTLVKFNDRMWIIDGIELGDVWSSQDGNNWTEEILNANFPNRLSHTSVVFNGKIWIIGGVGNNIIYNDIWSSSDGLNWKQETGNAAFPARHDHTSVVFDDRIWIIGGLEGDFELNDVWSSSDGINWTQEASNAPFLSRFGHSSAVFDNRIWVIGGYNSVQGSGVGYLNDIWSSVDGVNWIQETSKAEFSPRYGHSINLFDDKLWIIGGDGGGARNDIWSSTNGITWKKEADNAGFPGRTGHASIVFKEKIWIISGWSDGRLTSDIYYLE